MAVTIRLARHGRKKLPFYRIVATDKQMKRDGRYLELLGTLDPLTDPSTVKLNAERVKYWLSQGASASGTVAKIIEREIPGFLSGLLEGRKKKIQAKRAKRKTVAKARGTDSKKAAKKTEAKSEKKTAKKAAKPKAAKKAAK